MWMKKASPSTSVSIQPMAAKKSSEPFKASTRLVNALFPFFIFLNFSSVGFCSIFCRYFVKVPVPSSRCSEIKLQRVLKNLASKFFFWKNDQKLVSNFRSPNKYTVKMFSELTFVFVEAVYFQNCRLEWCIFLQLVQCMLQMGVIVGLGDDLTRDWTLIENATHLWCCLERLLCWCLQVVDELEVSVIRVL